MELKSVLLTETHCFFLCGPFWMDKVLDKLGIDIYRQIIRDVRSLPIHNDEIMRKVVGACIDCEIRIFHVDDLRTK